MPNIAMCTGEGCVRKETCHRHTAKPHPLWQTYMNPPFREVAVEIGEGCGTCVITQECDYYWSTKRRIA